MLEKSEFINLNSWLYIYLPLSFTGLQKTRVYNIDYALKYRERDGEWIWVTMDEILWRGFVSSAIMIILISRQQRISWPIKERHFFG